MTSAGTASSPAHTDEANAAVTKVGNLVKLELVLTVLCAAIPLILLAVEGSPPVEAISGFHDMQRPQFFYMPLTTAALLFIANGVRRAQWYNVGLGVALAGLTFFNTSDHHATHLAFTLAFFVGNPIVFVVFAPKQELWFRWLLALGMTAAIASWFLFGWIHIFWAESVSLWLIALHFAFEVLPARRAVKSSGGPRRKRATSQHSLQPHEHHAQRRQIILPRCPVQSGGSGHPL